MSRNSQEVNLKCVFLGLVLCVVGLDRVSGHGRLVQPPGRSTMWRYGYRTPPNYNDHQLFCGGFPVSEEFFVLFFKSFTSATQLQLLGSGYSLFACFCFCFCFCYIYGHDRQLLAFRANQRYMIGTRLRIENL